MGRDQPWSSTAGRPLEVEFERVFDGQPFAGSVDGSGFAAMTERCVRCTAER
jgi:hypothetical protein